MHSERSRLSFMGALPMALVVAVVLGTGASALPVVPPGFKAEVFARVTDPIQLSFDSAGNLFVGRDNFGS